MTSTVNGWTKWLVGALWTIALTWAAWASGEIASKADKDEFLRHEGRMEKRLDKMDSKLDELLKRGE